MWLYCILLLTSMNELLLYSNITFIHNTCNFNYSLFDEIFEHRNYTYPMYGLIENNSDIVKLFNCIEYSTVQLSDNTKFADIILNELMTTDKTLIGEDHNLSLRIKVERLETQKNQKKLYYVNKDINTSKIILFLWKIHHNMLMYKKIIINIKKNGTR